MGLVSGVFVFGKSETFQSNMNGGGRECDVVGFRGGDGVFLDPRSYSGSGISEHFNSACLLYRYNLARFRCRWALKDKRKKAYSLY